MKLFCFLFLGFGELTAFWTKSFHWKEDVHQMENLRQLKGALETDIYLGKKQGEGVVFTFDVWDEKRFQSRLPLLDQGFDGHALMFLSPENAVAEKESHPFLLSFPDGGDFCIEFRILMDGFSRHQILVRLHGPTLDEKKDQLIHQGFIIFLEEGRPKVELANMFCKGSKYRSFSLAAGKSITVGRWHHLAVAYTSSTGRLSLYLDQEEVDSGFASDNGKEDGSLLYPVWLPSHPRRLVFGERFQGRIDEFRLSPFPRSGFGGNPFPDSISTVVTRVFSIPAYIEAFRVRVQGSVSRQYLDLAIRRAAEYFHPDDERIPWQGARSEQWETNAAFSTTKRQYVQIKLTIRNYRLTRPQRLERCFLDLRESEPPLPPVFEKVKPLDRAMEISWLSSSEENIRGYRLHLFPVSDGEKSIDIVIPIEVVRMMGEVYTYTCRGLKNGVLYRGHLTAYDEWGQAHESRASSLFYITPQSP